MSIVAFELLNTLTFLSLNVDKGRFGNGLGLTCTGYLSSLHGHTVSGFSLGSGLLFSPSRSKGISLMQFCQLTGHVVSFPEEVLIEGLVVDAAD